MEQELAEKEELQNRLTTFEQELAEKEDQLKHSLNDDFATDVSSSHKSIRDCYFMRCGDGTSSDGSVSDNSPRDEFLDINAFPNEVIVKIFEYLTQDELGRIARVCRRWNDLTKTPSLWQEVNVKFHWCHNSQMNILKSFISKLPNPVTSMKVKFAEIENWIQPLDFQELCETLQEICPDVQKLILYKSKLADTYPSVIHLCSNFLPKLTCLVLRRPVFLDNAAIVEHGITSKIEILDITGSDMEHFSKPIFSEMTNLKQLYLKDTSINDTFFEEDVTFLNLIEVLDLGYTSVGSMALQAIRNYGMKLKELYMCWTLIDDNDLEFDSLIFPQLKTICLKFCKAVSCEGVVSLVQSCPSLQNIYVHTDMVSSYAKHPFVVANQCKLGIVKFIHCYKHDRRYCCT